MKIIPVLDIQQGQVVRGIAGKRSEYQPIQSTFTTSTNPVEVAQAIRSEFGLNYFYLADLDALAGETPNYDLFEQLSKNGFRLLIDAGIRSPEKLARLTRTSDHKIIIASETLSSSDFLETALAMHRAEKLFFSLDLKNGVPQSENPEWQNRSALQIFEQVWSFGFHQFIILDVAAVGTGTGVPTLELCQQIQQFAPPATLITGGGIRTEEDLWSIAQQKTIDGLLIASALHNGRLTPEVVQQIHSVNIVEN